MYSTFNQLVFLILCLPCFFYERAVFYGEVALIYNHYYHRYYVEYPFLLAFDYPSTSCHKMLCCIIYNALHKIMYFCPTNFSHDSQMLCSYFDWLNLTYMWPFSDDSESKGFIN